MGRQDLSPRTLKGTILTLAWSFEGEPDYDPKYLATFDGVRASRLRGDPPESQGLEVADVKFDASAGRSRGEEYNIGGLKGCEH